MKGIVLAGGSGTRLFPLTLALSKQLLPIYNKPMIYYPISVLMLAGIKDILIISSPEFLPLYQNLLKSGEDWGVKFSYCVQEKPEGIAQAFILGEDFIAEEPCCLILGDNIFYSYGLSGSLQDAAKVKQGAEIFTYSVHDPQRYGIVEFDKSGNPIELREKPSNPRSHHAITGIYFYDSQVTAIAKNLSPSARGELEITDLNRVYLEKGQLKVNHFGRGVAWLDTGTYSSYIEASNFVYALEKRQGQMICCPEEIAWRMGYIDTTRLQKLSERFAKNEYGQYLYKLTLDDNSYV
ncbi:MAG: glucose-1-phosphate thymidylyltransferase RfbA [Oligoflexales bacterium]